MLCECVPLLGSSGGSISTSSFCFFGISTFSQWGRDLFSVTFGGGFGTSNNVGTAVCMSFFFFTFGFMN